MGLIRSFVGTLILLVGLLLGAPGLAVVWLGAKILPKHKRHKIEVYKGAIH